MTPINQENEMNKPLSFEEWKEKYNVVNDSQITNISTIVSDIHGGNNEDISKYLNDSLYKDYEFYLSSLKKSN